MIFVIDDLLMNFFLDKKFLFVFGHVLLALLGFYEFYFLF